MKELRFATKIEAIQYLADYLDMSVRCANAPDIIEILEEIEKEKESDKSITKTSKELNERYDKLMEAYLKTIQEAKDLLKEMEEDHEIESERLKEVMEKNLISSFDFISEDQAIQFLSEVTDSRIVIDEDKNKIALWEESNMNSQMDILRMDSTLSEQENMSDELMFPTEIDAIQYLSDLLGKEIRIKE